MLMVIRFLGAPRLLATQAQFCACHAGNFGSQTAITRSVNLAGTTRNSARVEVGVFGHCPRGIGRECPASHLSARTRRLTPHPGPLPVRGEGIPPAGCGKHLTRLRPLVAAPP